MKMDTANEKILIIDDDESIGRVVELALQKAGYRVQIATSGVEGLRRLHEWRPDMVILDVMMPRMDGWATCRRIREISDIPVMMLTAKSGTANELEGLEGGADFYMTKPFEIPLLLGRIKAILRRSRLPSTGTNARVVIAGDLRIDLDRQEVIHGDQRLDLSPTEFKLLSVMAESAGRVVAREELLGRVWGQEYTGEDLYLKLYIRYLRQKIETDPGNPSHIITKRGVGYYLDDTPRGGGL